MQDEDIYSLLEPLRWMSEQECLDMNIGFVSYLYTTGKITLLDAFYDNKKILERFEMEWKSKKDAGTLKRVDSKLATYIKRRGYTHLLDSEEQSASCGSAMALWDMSPKEWNDRFDKDGAFSRAQTRVLFRFNSDKEFECLWKLLDIVSEYKRFLDMYLDEGDYKLLYEVEKWADGITNAERGENRPTYIMGCIDEWNSCRLRIARDKYNKIKHLPVVEIPTGADDKERYLFVHFFLRNPTLYKKFVLRVWEIYKDEDIAEDEKYIYVIEAFVDILKEYVTERKRAHRRHEFTERKMRYISGDRDKLYKALVYDPNVRLYFHEPNEEPKDSNKYLFNNETKIHGLKDYYTKNIP